MGTRVEVGELGVEEDDMVVDRSDEADDQKLKTSVISDADMLAGSIKGHVSGGKKRVGMSVDAAGYHIHTRHGWMGRTQQGQVKIAKRRGADAASKLSHCPLVL